MTRRWVILVLFDFWGYALVDAQQHYAVLINGFRPDDPAVQNSVIDCDLAGPSTANAYWNDTFLMWKTLLELGYPRSHITTLFSNGTAFQSQNVFYRPQLGQSVVDGAASIAMIESAFQSLASTMTAEDVLFVWTFGHGSHMGTHATLELLGGEESMMDTTFARLVNQVPCAKRVFILAQCESGGFVDDLAGPTTIVFSACDIGEMSDQADNDNPDGGSGGWDPVENDTHNGVTYYHSEFNYHFLNALRGSTVYYGFEVPSDLDSDGDNSVYEIMSWEFDADSQIGEYLHPQYSDEGSLGTSSYLRPLRNWAEGNKSTQAGATAGNNQRRLFRDGAGTLHEVFESSGEVFYRRSTAGGSSWNRTMQLTGGAGGRSSPCISVAGPTILAAWQWNTGSTYNIEVTRSTDNGYSWIYLGDAVGWGVVCPPPGPLPTISGSPDGSVFVAYRTQDAVKYTRSTNAGASWASVSSAPGTTGSCNMPSSAINTTYWYTKQTNLAYATDLPENTPHINCNYFDFQTASWGSAVDLCSVLPPNYVHHANPSLAVSASELYKTVHVAWDADDTYPGNRVIIHREGGFRYFPSVYSVLHYQSESKPSITGVNGETAWMAYQSSSGTAIWKRYYDGTYWSGSYGTWVGNGCDPQISVGSSSAKYIWTEGTSAPYLIQVSSEALSKTGNPMAYSRELNLIDPVGGGSISFEIGTPVVLHADGSTTEIPFAEVSTDSSLMDLAGLMRMGWSSAFAVPADAESLYLPIRITGVGQTALLSDRSGAFRLNAVEASSETVLKELASASIEGSTSSSATTLAIPAKSLPRVAWNSLLQLRPQVTGLKIGPETIVSLGHIYRKAEREGVAKGGETADKREEIPHRFLLHPNYPNPFNPTTRFTFDIAEPGEVSLTVHDMLGREVATVAEGHREPGRYIVDWNSRSNRKTVSSGVYLARLQVKGVMGSILYSQANRIIVVK